MAIDVNILPTIWDNVLTIGSLVIALVAIVTLVLTMVFRRRDSKRIRRNEIHKWARDVNRYAIKRRTKAVEKGSESHFLKDQERELFEIYEPFRSDSVYTETLAKQGKKELLKSVVTLRIRLQEQIKNIYDLREGRANGNNDMEKAKVLSDKIQEIHEASVDVIKQVAEADVSDLL